MNQSVEEKEAAKVAGVLREEEMAAVDKIQNCSKIMLWEKLQLVKKWRGCKQGGNNDVREFLKEQAGGDAVHALCARRCSQNARGP